MNKTPLTLSLTAGLSLLGSSAFGALKTYEIGNLSSVTASAVDPGLQIGASIVTDLAGTSFSLQDGQSFTVDFFNIWTTESTVNLEDDTASKPIVAKLDFSIPDEEAVFSGVTFGGKITWLLVLNQQYAKVEWDSPVTLSIADDREFSIALSDEVFNVGLFGLGSEGGTVEATIKQLSSHVPSVPDSGSTLILLGGALVGISTLVAGRKLSSRTR